MAKLNFKPNWGQQPNKMAAALYFNRKRKSSGLFDDTTVTITDSGSTGAYDGITKTLSNTGTGASSNNPRFSFDDILTDTENYRVYGRLTGDIASIGEVRLSQTNGAALIGTQQDIRDNGIINGVNTASGTSLVITLNNTLGDSKVYIDYITIIPE